MEAATCQVLPDCSSLLPSNHSTLGEIIYQGVWELPETFFLQLQALETCGEARVEATPTVVTTSGPEATITLSRSRNSAPAQRRLRRCRCRRDRRSRSELLSYPRARLGGAWRGV